MSQFYKSFLSLLQMSGNIPVFRNLTHVHIVYFTCVDWKLVFDVLKNCPMLQNVDLEIPPFFYINLLSFL